MEELKDLLKCLECPVCFHLMVPPITQCRNGHNICHTCKPRLDHCPTCREDLIDVRNKFIEQFSKSFELACKYEDSGCASKFHLVRKKEHEKECRHGPHKCPFFIVDRVKCEWEGPSKQMKQHIRKEHKRDTLAAVIPGKLPSCIPNYMKRIQDWCLVMFTFDKIFFYYSKTIDNNINMCFMFVWSKRGLTN